MEAAFYADKGKRRCTGRAATSGNVFCADPRKRVRRMGQCSDDASSSHRSVTVSMRARCRREAIGAMQRHVVRMAMRGEAPALSGLGGIGLKPPPGAIVSDSTARRPLPPARPECGSQALPSDAASSIRSPTPATERIDPEEWDDVLFPAIARSAQGSAVRSAKSSRVRSILSRCKELRAEIASERKAASEAEAAVQKQAVKAGILSGADQPDAAILDALRLVANTDCPARDKLRCDLRQMVPHEPRAVCGNPGFQITPGHQTRRHYLDHYGTHLRSGCQLKSREHAVVPDLPVPRSCQGVAAAEAEAAAP